MPFVKTNVTELGNINVLLLEVLMFYKDDTYCGHVQQLYAKPKTMFTQFTQ